MKDITLQQSESNDDWLDRADLSWKVYNYTCLVLDTIVFPICLTVLMIIFCVRKRREPALLLTPFFFSCMCIFDFARILAQDKPYYRILVACDYFCYFMGEWFFSSHYLKTSLILPYLFAEAKLEWLVRDAQREST